MARTRESCGLIFTQELPDLWVRYGREGQHDILVTNLGDMASQYECHVHEKGSGTVIEGPFIGSFDKCIAWAKPLAKIM